MRIEARLSSVLRAGVMLLAIGGCAQLPVEEVKRYSASYEQVRAVSETLIEDYAKARTASKPPASPTTGVPPRFPATFDPNDHLAGAKRSDAISARLAALDAVSKYNQALVALADGRGVESAKATVGTVVGGVASLLSIGIATPVVTAVFGAIEKVRTQAEFVKAYREVRSPDPACISAAQDTSQAKVTIDGKELPVPKLDNVRDAPQCGPFIKSIFAVLIADTANYYDQRVVLAGRRSDDVKEPGTRLLSRSINTVTARHAPPAVGSPLLPGYLALAAEYRQLSTQLQPKEPQSFGAGTEPYTGSANDELRGLVAGLREIAQREQKIVDDLNAFNARLGDYVRLLEQTEKYFDAVGEALERPADVDALAVKAFDFGSAIRRDGTDLRGVFLKLLNQ